MDTKSRLKLEEKINEFFEDEGLWNDPDHWVSESCSDRMADAAEAVYDNMVEFQEWAEKESVEL